MMRKNKKIIVEIFLGLVLVLCGCERQEELIVLQSVSDSQVVTEEQISAERSESDLIAVYVCGQVEHPGVVYLPPDARAVDAVEAAGGLTESADAEYINLASYVLDGEKLYIPDREEGQMLRQQEIAQMSSYVNLNTAGKEQLMTLPGIGESKAQDIIDYRNEHGDFAKIEDIMNISGIKESLFEKISDRIVVE